MKVIFVLLGLVALAIAGKVKHDGVQIWRISATKDQVKNLRALIDEYSLDVLGHSKDTVDVLVPAHFTKPMWANVAKHGLSYTVHVEDLQVLIDAEEEVLAKKPRVYDPAAYNTFSDIETQLQTVASNNPTMTSLQSLGQSYEGRDQWQMLVSSDVSSSRPAVWIDCGIHAREWITPATCMNGIDRLLTRYGSDPDITTMLDTYDIYIIPVVNPDGYEFTWSDNRMWRKNRHRIGNNTCIGVDLNRNFADPDWAGPGTSAQPCSDTYHGPSPASEIEIQNVQNGILALSPVAMYSIHSYSQMWMYPYGSKADDCPDKVLLDANTVVGVNALTAVFGTQYTFGSIADTIYLASGTTVDWAYNVASVTYSYTLELRPESSVPGFQLPADQIPDTVEETWIGLVAAINDMQ